MHCRYLIICFLLFTATCAVAQQNKAFYNRLPLSLAKKVNQLGFSQRGISIYVQAIGATQPLLMVNEDSHRNPASVIKLLTTAAALEKLGPDYTWKTEVYIDGDVRHKKLQGNLYIKGYGDPYMVPEYFWRFLHDLSSQGVRHIKGDLVLDDSYFQPDDDDPAKFDGQAHRTYNVLPSALMVNFQSVRFAFMPDLESGRVRIVPFPFPSTLQVKNHVRITNGHCGYWKGRIAMDIDNGKNSSVVKFKGRYPRSCGKQYLYRVVNGQKQYVEGVFRTLWNEQQGTLEGRLRFGEVPDNAKLLYTVESRPLAEIIRGINKFSNNVMTRQLLLTLGAEEFGAPGTTKKGINVVKTWLGANHVDYSGLELDNGAGLSRKTRVTARQLGELLLLMFHKPTMPEYMASLPIAGVDGTMKSRFDGEDMEGKMHIKTGSLNFVRTMAGYLINKEGLRYVVVMLHNDRRAHTYKGAQLQNALLEWVYQQ